MRGASRQIGRAIEVVGQEHRSVCPFMRPMTGDGIVLCGDWCQLRIASRGGEDGQSRACAVARIAQELPFFRG